jgi:hypothetical protein
MTATTLLARVGPPARVGGPLTGLVRLGARAMGLDGAPQTGKSVNSPKSERPRRPFEAVLRCAPVAQTG